MKNEFYILILFHFLCLTGCKWEHDSLLTQLFLNQGDMDITDTVQRDSAFSLTDPKIQDSSKYYFFIENVAGELEYKRYDFVLKSWQPVPVLFQHSFIGGPLHTGRIIHEQSLWRDSAWYLLLGKGINRGTVVAALPLAEIEINNDSSKSIYIFVPEEPKYRLDQCNQFDEWFTICSEQRFFVEYWIEQQFAHRYIKRIRWRPFAIDKGGHIVDDPL